MNVLGRSAFATMCLALLVAASLSLAACGTSGGTGSDGGSGGSDSAVQGDDHDYVDDATGIYASGIHHAVVTVTGYEPFTIRLDADNAPISVANFCALAQDGYYDGLGLYRIVDGFCLQGGTKGNRANGSDTSLAPIRGEFSANGVDNALADSFARGTVTMARTTDTNSATSTFFITLGSGQNVSQSLDGQYAAFGTIDEEGMAVVDSIVADHIQSATGENGAITTISAMPIIESIEIVD